MIPLKQQFLHKPEEGIWGDCTRAVIASFLDLPLDEVPHFGLGGPGNMEFAERIDRFLAERGLVKVAIPFSCELEHVFQFMAQLNRGIYYMLAGKSRTGCDHVVIALNDRIVHDPSLVDSGIVGPCSDAHYWVEFLVDGRSRHQSRSFAHWAGEEGA